jgi:hypothetical protein
MKKLQTSTVHKQDTASVSIVESLLFGTEPALVFEPNLRFFPLANQLLPKLLDRQLKKANR